MVRRGCLGGAVLAFLAFLAIVWLAWGWWGASQVHKDTAFVVPSGASLYAVVAVIERRVVWWRTDA